jgi:hypothetical protein
MWIVPGPCDGAALRGNLDNEGACNLNLPRGGNLNLPVGDSIVAGPGSRAAATLAALGPAAGSALCPRPHIRRRRPSCWQCSLASRSGPGPS